MNVENTTQLTELRKALGPDVVLGLIDLRDVTIVADCRTGSSSPETDFADQNPRPSQRVFGVACGRLDDGAGSTARSANAPSLNGSGQTIRRQERAWLLGGRE